MHMHTKPLYSWRLCQAHRGTIHSYIHLYAHFYLFSFRYGALHKASMAFNGLFEVSQQGVHKGPKILLYFLYKGGLCRSPRDFIKSLYRGGFAKSLGVLYTHTHIFIFFSYRHRGTIQSPHRGCFM